MTENSGNTWTVERLNLESQSWEQISPDLVPEHDAHFIAQLASGQGDVVRARNTKGHGCAAYAPPGYDWSEIAKGLDAEFSEEVKP